MHLWSQIDPIVPNVAYKPCLLATTPGDCTHSQSAYTIYFVSTPSWETSIICLATLDNDYYYLLHIKCSDRRQSILASLPELANWSVALSQRVVGFRRTRTESAKARHSNKRLGFTTPPLERPDYTNPQRPEGSAFCQFWRQNSRKPRLDVHPHAEERNRLVHAPCVAQKKTNFVTQFKTSAIFLLISGRTSHPLKNEQINDVSTCTGLTNLLVEFWQCDASGNYSTTSDGWLRGAQISGLNGDTHPSSITLTSEGNISIDSIFPGWPSHRAAHINLLVRGNYTTKGDIIYVGQIFFDDASTRLVASQDPYSTYAAGHPTNSKDSVWQTVSYPSTVNLTMILHDINNGLQGAIALTVNTSHSNVVTTSATPSTTSTTSSSIPTNVTVSGTTHKHDDKEPAGLKTFGTILGVGFVVILVVAIVVVCIVERRKIRQEIIQKATHHPNRFERHQLEEFE
ncbi:extracellular dioxygenase [Planoprotostelium fungivorum]|uniref:Extracellular dioxygenase n=1 Tax=Planoprotostelium fungivorum TaxID=1890364 RepID=A0A2P6NYP3_9EUKA|nr:extracellular dioxygenase [Planoprotostelium fungivorum]